MNGDDMPMRTDDTVCIHAGQHPDSFASAGSKGVEDIEADLARALDKVGDIDAIMEPD